jgi:phosphatidylinositol alpha-mannosyltransferase
VFDGLATGAPVITADTPAVRELLDDESAVLVPPGDATALAEALRDLSGDENKRTEIAARGREVYQERASRRVLGERWLSVLLR